jgi:hypothetical protein
MPLHLVVQVIRRYRAVAVMFVPYCEQFGDGLAAAITFLGLADTGGRVFAA